MEPETVGDVGVVALSNLSAEAAPSSATDREVIALAVRTTGRPKAASLEEENARLTEEQDAKIAALVKQHDATMKAKDKKQEVKRKWDAAFIYFFVILAIPATLYAAVVVCWGRIV